MIDDIRLRYNKMKRLAQDRKACSGACLAKKTRDDVTEVHRN